MHRHETTVVVNFFTSGNFVFLLFLGIAMYANEVAKTEEKSKLPQIKNIKTTTYALKEH